MWVFTSDGFISVVKSDQEADTLVVRARKVKHLNTLFPDREVTVLPNRDYCCRVFIPTDEFAVFMVKHVLSIEYTNFKDSIKDDEYHDVCLDVWGTLYNYQNRINGRNRGYKSAIFDQV